MGILAILIIDFKKIIQLTPETIQTLAFRIYWKALPFFVYIAEKNSRLNIVNSQTILLKRFLSTSSAYLCAKGEIPHWWATNSILGEQYLRPKSGGIISAERFFLPGEDKLFQVFQTLWLSVSENLVGKEYKKSTRDAILAQLEIFTEKLEQHSRIESRDLIEMENLELAKSIIKSIELDIDFSIANAAKKKLIECPLWLEGEPKYNTFLHNKLFNDISSNGQDWTFWMQFLDSIRTGRPSFPHVDSLAIVTIDDDILNDDVANINKELLRVSELVRSRDEQSIIDEIGSNVSSKKGVNFDVANGRIDVSQTERDLNTFSNNEIIQSQYVELRHKIKNLSEEPSQLLGIIAGYAESLLSLPENAREIIPSILWSRMNSFRVILQIHQDALNLKQSESGYLAFYDERIYTADVELKLTDAVSFINAIVLSNQELLKFEAKSLENNSLEEIRSEAEKIKDAILNVIKLNEVVTAETATVLKNSYLDMNPSSTTKYDIEAAEAAHATTANFWVKFVDFANKAKASVHKSTKFVASEATKEIIKSIIKNHGVEVANYIGNFFSQGIGAAISRFFRELLK